MGPEVSIRRHNSPRRIERFELWVDGEPIFFGKHADADDMIKILRKIGLFVRIKNLEDGLPPAPPLPEAPEYDVSDW
jgi:hypothetical protein